MERNLISLDGSVTMVKAGRRMAAPRHLEVGVHHLEAMRGAHGPFELVQREGGICFFHPDQWGLQSVNHHPVIPGWASRISGILAPFSSLHSAGSHLVSNVVLPLQLLPVLVSWQHFQQPKFAPQHPR